MPGIEEILYVLFARFKNNLLEEFSEQFPFIIIIN